MKRLQGMLVMFGLVALATAWQVSGHFRPWTSFQQQWIAGFGAAAVVLAAAIPRRPWHWPGPALAMGALAFVPLAQGLLGQVAYLSDWSLAVLYVLSFGLCIAAANNLVADEPERWPDNLMVTLLAGAALSAALALMQWLRVDLPHISVDPLRPGERVFANLGQPNHLATLQCLGLSAALYFVERRRLGVMTAVLLCGFMGWALVLTQSRIGWVFGLVLVAWCWAGRRYVRLNGHVALLGLLLYAGGTVALPHVNEALLLAQPGTNLEQRVSAGTRPANWLALAEASLRKPWVGWGWTQVSQAQLAIGSERPVSVEVVHNAHNVVLDLAVWMGWPAAALMVVLASRWLVGQVRSCSDPRHWAFLLAIAALAIHALTEYPLDYSYFLLPLGLLVGTAQRWGPASAAPSTGRGPPIVAWLAGVVMLFWIAVEYFEVEESARGIRMVMAGVGIDKVRHVPPPNVKLLDAPREYHRFWITPPARGMTADQLDWMREVARRNHFAPVLLRYALAAGLNGRPEESARMLRAICHLNVPARCKEARESWQAATSLYPELVAIPPP